VIARPARLARPFWPAKRKCFKALQDNANGKVIAEN